MNTQGEKKKNIMLEISRKYIPENYVLIKNIDERFINLFTTSSKMEEYVLEYPIVIHEAYHSYSTTINDTFFKARSFREYRLNDSLTITISKFKSVPSREIASIVSLDSRKELYYFETYITSKDSFQVTQLNGFEGLLEEYTAYFQGLKAYTLSYYFLRDKYKWDKTKIWIHYLLKYGAIIYSTKQFSLLLSYYLQYCKVTRPEIFNRIVNDKSIKDLYTHVEQESESLIKIFFKNRNEILENINTSIVSDSTGIKIKHDNNLIYNIDTHLKRLRLTDSILKAPEHRVLSTLRL